MHVVNKTEFRTGRVGTLISLLNKQNSSKSKDNSTLAWAKILLDEFERLSSPLGFIEGHNAPCNVLITEESFHSLFVVAKTFIIWHKIYLVCFRLIGLVSLARNAKQRVHKLAKSFNARTSLCGNI